MRQIKCQKCNITVGFAHGIEVIKVIFICPGCGTKTIIEEIV